MSTSTRATEPKRSKRRPAAQVHQVIRWRRGPLSRDVLSAIVTALRAGEVVIFPTETVYGIGTSAFSFQGIQKIYRLKGRQAQKRLALLVPSLEAAAPLVESIPPEASRLAKRYWPGPLTLVLRASALGKLVTGGLSTIGIRVPDHRLALQILRAVGLPLATTSVNRSGELPATTGRDALRLFGRKVSWVIDGGSCDVQTASSVVDVSHYPFTVIREGAITKKELEAALTKHR